MLSHEQYIEQLGELQGAMEKSKDMEYEEVQKLIFTEETKIKEMKAERDRVRIELSQKINQSKMFISQGVADIRKKHREERNAIFMRIGELKHQYSVQHKEEELVV